MNFIIKKGSSSSYYILLLTGLFLIFVFSYILCKHILTSNFIITFPGDWDKPLAILIGFITLYRARKFKNKTLELFIKTTPSQLTFRTIETESIKKIHLNSIKKIFAKENYIKLITIDNTEYTISLVNINTEKERKDIRKYLLNLVNN